MAEITDKTKTRSRGGKNADPGHENPLFAAICNEFASLWSDLIKLKSIRERFG
jgi:hypothetical protein